MERLVNEASITRNLHLYTTAQDTLDLELLKFLCAPDVVMDVSGHLPDHPTTTFSPDQLASVTHQTLGGFTATQHCLGNYIFTWDSDTKARVTSRVIAYHCIQENDGDEVESVTARAYWHVDVEKRDDRWEFCGFRIERNVPMDNPRLYAKASERMKSGKGRAERKS